MQPTENHFLFKFFPSLIDGLPYAELSITRNPLVDNPIGALTPH